MKLSDIRDRLINAGIAPEDINEVFYDGDIHVDLNTRIYTLGMLKLLENQFTARRVIIEFEDDGTCSLEIVKY